MTENFMIILVDGWPFNSLYTFICSIKPSINKAHYAKYREIGSKLGFGRQAQPKTRFIVNQADPLDFAQGTP